jgi:hypothetical protein
LARSEALSLARRGPKIARDATQPTFDGMNDAGQKVPGSAEEESSKFSS